MHLLEIKTARLERPFSTSFGSYFKIPSSPYHVIIYPAYIEVIGIGSFELPIQKARSLAVYVDFAALQLVIEVRSEDAFSRFNLRHEGLALHMEGKNLSQQLKVDHLPYKKRSCASIHFGIHKECELAAMEKRGDLLEWLAFWHAFGNFMMDGKKGKGGNWDLLQNKNLEALLLSSRKGLWTPFEEDIHHLGWVGPVTERGDVDLLLQKPSEMIEENLLLFKEGRLHLLPFNDIAISSGRASHLSVDNVRVDLHWRSKSLIKAKVVVLEDQELCFAFPKPIKKARLWKDHESCFIENGESISFSKSSIYYLDRFTH